MFSFGIPMKLVRPIIMCLNETCRIFDVFFLIKNGLKQGDTFLPLLFTFALDMPLG